MGKLESISSENRVMLGLEWEFCPFISEVMQHSLQRKTENKIPERNKMSVAQDVF